MTPTPKLRFVKRVIPTPEFGDNTGRYVHVLQQWWENGNVTLAVYTTDADGNFVPPPKRGEWRDVPLEDEK